MGHTATRILLYAVVAAASPVGLVATFAVLTSRRGRGNGLAFVAGFVLGQSAAFIVAYIIGSAATAGQAAGHRTFSAALELALGIGLLMLAWPERRREGKARDGPSRTRALLARLQGLRPRTAFTVGALLGVGGIKRLSITIIAGASVGVAGLAPAEDALLGAIYVVVASVLIWLPITGYLVAGKRASDWMSNADTWLLANERRLTFFSTLLFGLLLTSDALVRLV